MAALPRILSVADLPLPELAAARLDGDLFPLGRGWAPCDVPGTSEDRAAAASVGLPRQWVAELATAAWIWGIGSDAPDPARFCVPFDSRGPKPRAGVVLRERNPRSTAHREVGGVRVTDPAQTLVDLLRSPVADDEGIAAAVLDLLPAPERAAVEARVARLPDGRRAIARLGRISRR